MKKSALLVLAAVTLAAAPAFAATKTYQVTGPVTDMSPGTITVQKGSEKWEIACGTACPSDVKIGSKVTVQYTMTAASVVSKPAAAMMKSGSSATGKGAAPAANAAMQPPMATGSSGASTATTQPGE